jgi:ubiquinone/menaquinone biosynthesis C-methylase UbiE
MADEQHRFSGTLAEEYDLITLAYPDFETFQRRMIEAIANTAVPAPRILEIGTGNGFTTRLLMEVPDARIVTIDNDAQMVAQAREQLGDTIEIVEADAFEYLAAAPAGSFDVVASAFTLHNMEVSYRDPVEREVFRVLAPGGLFTNADKYAPDGQERFDALVFQVERFFDAFVERGKLDLLRKWVTHNITDQSPRFVMTAADTPARLQAIGFENVTVGDRSHMQAVLRAHKPQA